MKMKKSVLIIDDEAIIVEMMKDTFESRGIPAETALSGAEGLVKAADLNPGAIVVDLKMPKMDGYEVIRRLKENNDTRSIPVVVFTSVEIHECRSKCVELGAADVYSKSDDRSELIQRIKELIGEGK